MWLRNSDKYKEIIKEIELEESNEKKAEKAYSALRDESLKGILTDADKKGLFNCIKNATKGDGSEQIVATWCFFGDCYYYGYGCKKSLDDAISSYKKVMDLQGDYASEWKNWAASKIGNIYIDQQRINEAKPYIHMSTSARDYEKLANVLWENGEERASLEDYKKAGDYGRVECYAQAVKRCLSSSDTGIKEKAIEYAIMYFKSDEDIRKKQKSADTIMYYFYDALDKAEPREKERLKMQFERFKRILDDNGLKKKSERTIKKLFKGVKENAGVIGVFATIGVSAISIISSISKKK